jgi:glycosyltransferase involved in cell wall biosynthesis
MKKSKLLILIPTLNIGGAEKIVLYLINNLSESDFEISLVLLKNQKPLASQFNKKISIYYLYSNKNFLINILSSPFTFFKVLKKISPDIIHSNLWGLYTFPLISLILFRDKIKLYSTIHTSGKSYSSKKLFDLLSFYIEKKIYTIFNFTLIAVSNEVQKMLISMGFKNKIILISNGVEFCSIDNFIISKIKSKLSSGYTCPILVHVGNSNEVKRHIDIINACKLLNDNNNDFKLILIGKGILQDFGVIINNSGFKSKIHVFENCKNAHRILSISDIGIFPSLYEGCPLSLIEMMSHSLPIIATNIESIKEITNNGSCAILVNTKSPIELYKAIIDLLKNKFLFDELATNSNIIYSKNYSINIMINKYEYLFKN